MSESPRAMQLLRRQYLAVVRRCRCTQHLAERPRRRAAGTATIEHLEPRFLLSAVSASQADALGVADRDHHLGVRAQQAKVVALHLAARQDLVGDLLDNRNTLARVDHLVADLEVHSFPFRERPSLARPTVTAGSGGPLKFAAHRPSEDGSPAAGAVTWSRPQWGQTRAPARTGSPQ